MVAWLRERWRIFKEETYWVWENPGHWYVRFWPRPGFSLPWFKERGTGERQRIRFAYHHGVQLVVWRFGCRWCPKRQILGKSKVKGEMWSRNEKKRRLVQEKRQREGRS